MVSSNKLSEPDIWRRKCRNGQAFQWYLPLPLSTTLSPYIQNAILHAKSVRDQVQAIAHLVILESLLPHMCVRRHQSVPKASTSVTMWIVKVCLWSVVIICLKYMHSVNIINKGIKSWGKSVIDKMLVEDYCHTIFPTCSIILSACCKMCNLSN